ncbi:MAG TPA: hypothetical protein VJU13_06150 [Candidatus Nitrosocosmicus sp.]|nr:hypothetical protein [Candidatus Nitrosocosmicus sp.]
MVIVTFGTISFTFYFTEYYLGYYNIPNIISCGIAVYLIFFLVRRSGNSILHMDKVQLFLFLSFVSWFSAEAMFGYYSGVLKTDPYPSMADIFYLAGYIFIVLLLWSLNKAYKIEISVFVSLLVTFSLIAFYVLYVSVFIFNVYSLSGSIIDLMLVFAYPIFDLLIIISGFLYYFREKEISLNKGYLSWLLFSAFGFFFFLADVIFGFDDLFGFSQDDHLFDLFFNIGYLMLGISVLTRIFYLNIHSRND